MTATAQHHVAGVSFTPEQLAARRHTLGASEVPAVLGLDRYKGPHDIWLQKKGLAPAFEGNEHTEWGLRVEPAIRQKVADVLGVEITMPGGTMYDRTHPWMSATPDGLFTFEDAPHVLEIKNKSDRQSVHWGVSGTDEVPFDIAAQVYWQLMVTGLQRAVVAVLFGKSDFRLYHLTRDHDVAASIFDQCNAFWQKHIVDGHEPDITGSPAAAEYLKQKFAVHGPQVRDATREEDALIAQLRVVREQKKAAETQEEALKTKLMAAIGHDAGLVGRSGRVTWQRPNGAQIGWKDVALAMKAPQSLIDQFSTPMARKFGSA